MCPHLSCFDRGNRFQSVCVGMCVVYQVRDKEIHKGTILFLKINRKSGPDHFKQIAH